MEIKGNVFVVTGGGSGLGAATARMIVAAGGKAVLADVNKEAGEALAAELGANARFVATDVTNEDSAKGAFAAAVVMALGAPPALAPDTLSTVGPGGLAPHPGLW